MSPDSSGRDRELQRQLGVATPALHDLIDVFYDDYDAKNWGFSRFGSLTDRTRALVSDLVLSSADGVVVALREMGLHERAFNRLLGPNGRTMPGPETTPEEYAEMHELPMHSVGALRALGSALDCLTAVCIGVLGVQSSIHGAAASALFQPFAAPQGAAQGQVAAAQRGQRRGCRGHRRATDRMGPVGARDAQQRRAPCTAASDVAESSRAPARAAQTACAH